MPADCGRAREGGRVWARAALKHHPSHFILQSCSCPPGKDTIFFPSVSFLAQQCCVQGHLQSQMLELICIPGSHTGRGLSWGSAALQETMGQPASGRAFPRPSGTLCPATSTSPHSPCPPQGSMVWARLPCTHQPWPSSATPPTEPRRPSRGWARALSTTPGASASKAR